MAPWSHTPSTPGSGLVRMSLQCLAGLAHRCWHSAGLRGPGQPWLPSLKHITHLGTCEQAYSVLSTAPGMWGVCVRPCVIEAHVWVCVRMCVASQKPPAPLSHVEGKQEWGWPSLLLTLALKGSGETRPRAASCGFLNQTRAVVSAAAPTLRSPGTSSCAALGFPFWLSRFCCPGKDSGHGAQSPRAGCTCSGWECPGGIHAARPPQAVCLPPGLRLDPSLL